MLLHAATTRPAISHPTDRELLDAQAEARRCVADTAASARLDPIRIGTTVEALRARFDEAELGLQVAGAPTPGSESIPAPSERPARFERESAGNLARVEYESWRGSVYRIRWRLADRFERPMLDEFSRRASTCFGPPEFDQTFRAEPGSADATIRRIGWTHGERRIELRQLHPLRGGPVYLTVTSEKTMRALARAGLSGFPPPRSTEPWWRRSLEAPRPVAPEERKRLGDAFQGLLSQLDH